MRSRSVASKGRWLGVVVAGCGLLALTPHDARADYFVPQPDSPRPSDNPAPEAAPAPEVSQKDPGQPSLDALHFELGAKASYVTPPIRGGTNPFGAGFGGRAGLILMDVYVGASVVDYLGGSDITLSDRALLYGLEIGYGFRFRAFGGATFTLRPLVGVGDAAVSHTDPSLAKVDVVTSASGTTTSKSSDTITVNSIYLQPGLTAMLSGGLNFIAVNANVLVVPAISYGGNTDPSTWLAYGLQVELGLRF